MAQIKCPDCDYPGDGKCSDCHGTGSGSLIGHLAAMIAWDEEAAEELRECDTCGGSGVCQTCDGEGYIEDEE